MRFPHVIAILAMSVATAFADQAEWDNPHADAETIQKELREAAGRGDTESLADYALSEFAETLGYIDRCEHSDSKERISKLADRYAAWVEPGFFARFQGERSKIAGLKLEYALRSYAYGEIRASSEGCPNAMFSTTEELSGIKNDELIFNAILEMEPSDGS